MLTLARVMCFLLVATTSVNTKFSSSDFWNFFTRKNASRVAPVDLKEQTTQAPLSTTTIKPSVLTSTLPPPSLEVIAVKKTICASVIPPQAPGEPALCVEEVKHPNFKKGRIVDVPATDDEAPRGLYRVNITMGIPMRNPMVLYEGNMTFITDMKGFPRLPKLKWKTAMVPGLNVPVKYPSFG